MNPAVLAAIGAAFTAWTAVAAGSAITDRISLKLTRLERILLSFLAGSAALSLLVFLLTAAHLAYAPVFIASGLAIITTHLWRSRTRTVQTSASGPVPRWWLLFAIVLAAPFVELYVCHALGPEYSPDGVAYHLGFVARYLHEHHFPIITTNFYASFPEGLEMLFLFAFSIGKHSAAAAVHLLFLFAGAASLIAYGLRFGRARAGFAAAVLFFLSPVVGADATTAYVDAGEAAVCIGLFLALQIWRQDENDWMLAIAGILAGFAAAIKYPGFIAPLYAVAAVAFHLRKDRKRLTRCLALIAIPSVLLTAPWLIKNAIEVGNPVSPFANRLFPNPYVHVSFEEGYRERLEHWNGVARRDIPLEVTVNGARLQGIIGPVFLLAPIALLALADPLGRQVVFALFCFLLPYPGNIGTRFLIPALPFLALAICISLARWRYVLGAVLVFHFVASQPYFVRQYSHAPGIIERNWSETLRIRPEQETLRARVDGYAMAQYIDRDLPRNARIYEVGGFPLAYSDHPVDGYYEGALDERLYFVFFSAVSAFPDWAPTWRTDFHFNATRCKRIRIARAGAETGPVWAVSEVRFYDNGHEITPKPDWRFRASSFAYDSHFAFDGNLATSWKAWERSRPGMFLEAAFTEPIEITDIRIDAPFEQRHVTLTIEGEDVQGRLQAVLASAQSRNLALPAGYQALVGNEFKAQGYTHFIMKKGIPGYDEVRRNPAEWRMRFVAERDGYILCQFE